jgi:hypothetical protein
MTKLFVVSADQIRRAAESSLAASPQDTELFLFRVTAELFCQGIPPA